MLQFSFFTFMIILSMTMAGCISTEEKETYDKNTQQEASLKQTERKETISQKKKEPQLHKDALMSPSPTQAPKATKHPETITQLERTRTDNYAWMKDKNWQEVLKKPKVLRKDIRQYLEAENAYTKAHLETPTKALQKTLFQEIKGRIKEEDSSVPSPDGAYSYFVRYTQGAEYPVYVRKGWNPEKHEPEGEEIILLDVNKAASNKKFYNVSVTSHSPNHRYFAYAVDEKGSEYYTIKIIDLKTGKELPDQLQNAKPSIVWSNDSKSILWVWQDDNNRGRKVFTHRLGASTETDTLLYEETDPGFFLSIDKTESKQYILINAGNHTSNEIYYLPASQPHSQPKLIAKRQKEILYSVTHHGKSFYILTNIGGAKDYKVMTALVTHPAQKNWKDFIPYHAGTMILHISAYKDFLLLYERENALPRLILHFFKTEEEKQISFSEEAYSLSPRTGYEYDTPYLRFSYSSLTTPEQLFEYNAHTDIRKLLKTREVPSGHTPGDYVTKRLQAKAHDNEMIPVTLLYKKTTPLDGSAPLYLYGYGSYGVTITPNFQSNIFSLVDRGYVFAIAHIRGGKAKGTYWYETGKLNQKTNTFKDFISVAEMLIAKHYTKAGQIVAVGRSAGGLLMGAISNMRPDLFGAIVAGVPFVDVLNTMSDTELPLTPPEWPEWGNPIKNKKDYDTILEYSPYDNVRETQYPAMLITGGLTDPRVTYWEPTKWAAKLRTYNQGKKPIYLKIDMGAGHGGSSGRFKHLEEVALEYAFILKQLSPKASDLKESRKQ